MTIVLFVCAIAVAHTLFLAGALLTVSRKVSNILLALLLTMLAVRVGKSVTGIILPGHMYFFSVLGLGSMSLIGPLLFLYTRSLFNSGLTLRTNEYLQLAAGFVAVTFTLLTGTRFLAYSYYLFTGHVFLYILLSLSYGSRFRSDDLKFSWIMRLLSGIFLISVTFVLQLLFYAPLTYELIVCSAALLFYVLSWMAIPRAKLFYPEGRKKPVDEHLYDEISGKILALMERDEIFIDPNLNLTKLGGMIKAPPYLVSRAVNYRFKKSFSELLLSYRIKKSEQLLLATGSKLLTIEAIAYESGFNTLSSFYAAFKKVHNITPAVFRDSGDQTKMKIA